MSRTTTQEEKPDAAERLDSPCSWFAVWNTRHGVAYAIEAYPDILTSYERAVQRARRAVGDRFAGPFDSRQQAHSFAVAKLITHRQQLD